MSDVAEVDQDLIDMVGRLFAERSGHAVVERAEQLDLDRELWDAVEELGLPLVGVSEEWGGSGGSTREALTIQRIAAAHAVPLPLAETYLAGWMLAETGVEIPSGPLSFAVAESTSGSQLPSVAWSRGVHGLVVLRLDDASPQVALVSASDVRSGPGRDLAGQPSAPVELTGSPSWTPISPALAAGFLRRVQLVRAAQIAGALRGTLDLTSAYVGQREQFGRPVGSFQAVQHHIVTLAQAAEITALAVAQAELSLGSSREPFEVAAAKLVADQSAADAARAAHQAHGAIGMTREYRLQQLTRRLHVWRLSDGREKDLARRIGDAVAAAPSAHAIITGVDEEPMP